MADPITAAFIAGLVVQKFVEGAAGEAGKQLVGDLWTRIVKQFKGDKRAETVLATVVETKGEKESVEDLTTYLKGEMKQDGLFASDLQQLAEQIINVQNQSQSQVANTFTSQGNSQMRAVGVVHGTANLGDQK